MANLVNVRLLLRREHFQQQTALRTLLPKRLQQPQLRGVVIGVVMLLADDEQLRPRQTRQQFLCRQYLAAVQITNFATDWRGRGNMLTPCKQQHR